MRFPAVLFLGLFLGWLAWRSGSVWPAVAAHAVNNALGSAVAAGADGGAAAGAHGTVAASLAVIVLGGAALAPVGMAWLRATPSPPGLAELLVRRDPADPSVRFRLPLVPPAWASLAVLGLLLYLALAIRHAMAR